MVPKICSMKQIIQTLLLLLLGIVFILVGAFLFVRHVNGAQILTIAGLLLEGVAISRFLLLLYKKSN